MILHLDPFRGYSHSTLVRTQETARRLRLEILKRNKAPSFIRAPRRSREKQAPKTVGVCRSKRNSWHSFRIPLFPTRNNSEIYFVTDALPSWTFIGSPESTSRLWSGLTLNPTANCLQPDRTTTKPGLSLVTVSRCHSFINSTSNNRFCL